MVYIAKFGRYCSATHPSRTTKPKIRILGNAVREECVALHYSVHFFFLRIFSSHNRGGGYQCKICTVPTPFLRLPDNVVEWEETAPYTHIALSSNPSFSRADRADTKTVWELYRSCTDTLPLDYDRCVKEKIRKKKKVDGVV